MTIPLNSYMVNVIMRCEEVRDLDLRGPVHIFQGVQMPDVHNVFSSPAHAACTGMSCGRTKSKKCTNLGREMRIINCLNKANNALGLCLPTLTKSMRQIWSPW